MVDASCGGASRHGVVHAYPQAQVTLNISGASMIFAAIDPSKFTYLTRNTDDDIPHFGQSCWYHRTGLVMV